MRVRHVVLAACAVAGLCLAAVPASGQAAWKPNILFIMGDDMGWLQPSIYHRALMVG
jgi:arylsulfatase